MGCCSGKNTESMPHKHPVNVLPSSESDLRFVIIESKSLDLKNEIDEPVIIIDKINLNALGYSLVSGRINNFIYLIEKLGANIVAMESILESQGLNGLDIIIEKGYIDLLKYYFPLYKSSFSQKFSNLEDSETSCSLPRSSRKTPIHIATEKGYLEVLEYMYFSLKDLYAPEKYNIYHIDEYTGENSVLIACKKCHFSIVKFLKETCNADFNLKSKRSESALHLAAFGSKNKKTEGFELIKYLVESVKIDISFQYEEVLLILNDSNILNYMEQMLQKIGIFCTKDEVDRKYSISSYKNYKLTYAVEDELEFTIGAISSIDANVTLSLINASFFQDSDFN
jgi:hypothetical protein